MTDRMTIKRGTTEVLYITVNKLCDTDSDNDNDDEITQENLSNMTVSFWIKRYITDADSAALFTKTSTTSPGIIVDPESGLVRIQINPSDTSTLPSWYQDYYFKLEVVDGLGNLVRSGEGTIGVYP